MSKKCKKILSYVLLAAMLLTVIPFSAYAEEQITYKSAVKLAGSGSTRSRATAIYQNYLYVMEGNNSTENGEVEGHVSIYNISDLTNITNVTPADNTALTSTSGFCDGGKGGLTLNGGYLYVGFKDCIRKFSLENPANPTLVATFASTSDGDDGRNMLTVFDNWLIAGSGGRMITYNLNGASVGTSENATKRYSDGLSPVATDGKYVYMLSNESTANFDTIIAIDAKTYAPNTWDGDAVSANKIKLYTAASALNVVQNKMQAEGGYLYFSIATENKVYRINTKNGVSENMTPEVVFDGTVITTVNGEETQLGFRDFVVDGNRLYVRANVRNSGILVYDMTENGIVQQETISLTGIGDDPCIRLNINDGYIYYSDNSNTILVPVDKKGITLGLEGEAVEWNAQTTITDSSNGIFASAIYGNYLYINARNDTRIWVDVYDITDPKNPQKCTTTDSLLTSDVTNGGSQIDAWNPIFVKDGYLYYGVYKVGVRKYSLENPADPKYIATYTDRENNDRVNNIYADDGRIYASEAGRLKYWDNSDTTVRTAEYTINALGETTNAGSNGKIEEHNGYLYTTDYYPYVGDGQTVQPKKIYVTRKSDMHLMYATDNSLYYGMEIDSEKGYGYVITSDFKLKTFDLKDINNLKNDVYVNVLDVEGMTGESKNMYLSGKYLFVGSTGMRSETLYAFDVSVATAPKLVFTAPNVTLTSIAAKNEDFYAIEKVNGYKGTITPYISTMKKTVDEEKTEITELPVYFRGTYYGGDVKLYVDDTEITTFEKVNGEFSYEAEELTEGTHSVTAKIGDFEVTKSYTVAKMFDASVSYETEGTDIVSTVTFENKYRNEKDFFVVLAAYSGGTLVKADVKTPTAYAKNTSEVTLKIPSVEYDRLVTYIWMPNMVPYKMVPLELS